ncbi:restriction endonuclease subunit S [Bacteroides acidifaciens]|jgi:type I restriction enzyme S subunit|uniref:restriction endonuclease subunit S n=3 Tax=Bacteroides acidifaciens TaxID=85831 RepID=UPI00256FB204|nr:restriction endonuclease subunit S [Bacteroides acidifaciens]
MELKKIHISDIGKIITGKTPRTSVAENYDGDIPFLTPSEDLSHKSAPRTTKTLTEKGLNEVRNCLLPPRSICVSCIGSDLGKVVMTIEPTVTNQQFNSIIPNKNFNADFVYYLMTLVGRELNYLSKTSTAVPIINKSSFSNYEVEVPDLETQEKIASILSSLDSKIELNRRINDNLEQQAQALFKSWFVDFEPFKNGKFVDSEMGMIPEGWKVGTIGEYCSIRSGYAFKSSWWQETGTKVIKIKNITDNKTLDMSDCSYVSSDKTYKAIDFQASPGDLIIAMTGATIGKFCIIPFHNDKIYINQRVGKFFLGNNPLDRLPFIYCCLSYEPIYNEIISKGQGSAQPNIGGADIENIRIILSPSTELKEFNSLLRPIFQKKMQIESELSKLSVLRDTLLPRLMSGELKINDLNC